MKNLTAKTAVLIALSTKAVDINVKRGNTVLFDGAFLASLSGFVREFVSKKVWVYSKGYKTSSVFSQTSSLNQVVLEVIGENLSEKDKREIRQAIQQFVRSHHCHTCALVTTKKKLKATSTVAETEKGIQFFGIQNFIVII